MPTSKEQFQPELTGSLHRHELIRSAICDGIVVLHFPQLTQVIGARNDPAIPDCPCNCGEKQGGQNADDDNHNQELDESEPLPLFHWLLPFSGTRRCADPPHGGSAIQRVLC